MPRRIAIVLFDMDGVLARIKSSWAYLHKYFGVDREAEEIKRLYEEGRIDYIEWMRLDTSLWAKARGGCVPRSELEEALSRVPIDPYLPRLGYELHRRGLLIGIVSSGIDLLARRVARRLGADVWVANRLSFDKRGCLVPGGVPLVGTDKVPVTRRILGELGIPPERAMFVGDSVFDRSVMRLVGYPVAYGDCPKLDGVAKCRVYRLDEIPSLVDYVEEKGECPGEA